MSGIGQQNDRGRARPADASGKPETARAAAAEAAVILAPASRPDLPARDLPQGDVRAGVLTVSDRVSRGEAEDRSGPRAAALLAEWGFEAEVRVVSEGVAEVEAGLRSFLSGGVALVVTTGGTGFGPRDLTPEATRQVIEREAPGLAEAMRAATFGTNPHGMLSRGVAGIAGSSVVVNLPGSVAGVEESLAVIGPALRHACELAAGKPSGHGAAWY